MPGRPVNYDDKKLARILRKLAELEAAALITGEIRAFARVEAPDGWLEADGSAVLVADYDELAVVIYCGDDANATADWGYRATNDWSSDTNRDIAGDYIVLPDYRGEFLRGWDNGRGKDAGRGLHSGQLQGMLEHTHTGTADSGGDHTPSGSVGAAGAHAHTYNQGSVTTNSNTTATGASARVVSYSNGAASTSGAPDHTHSLTMNPVSSHTHVLAIDMTGGDETRPTNLAALICIKT